MGLHGRRGNPPTVVRIKNIPMHWLSCARHGEPIKLTTNKSIIFIPMKSPLPNKQCQNLLINPSWTIEDTIAFAKTTIQEEDNYKIHVINVSATSELISPQEWERFGCSYSRVQINKDYKIESIDQFCKSINSIEIPDNFKLICLIYSGCGLNRVGFCITAYLSQFGGKSLQESLDICDSSLPRMIFRSKPLNVLCEYFNEQPMITGPPPSFLSNDDKIYPIGDVPLPLDKYQALKKISSKNSLTDVEKAQVIDLLNKSADESWARSEANIPYCTYNFWQAHDVFEIRSNSHLCTFEPRGTRGFIIVSENKSVCFVDINGKVVLLDKINVMCQVPAVASCYLIELRNQAVFLMTDILLLGEKKLNNQYLKDRLSYLAYEFTEKLAGDKKQSYPIQFIFRPMCKPCHVGKLKKDLPKLFVKCDGISFIETDAPPGRALFLPINPSAVLRFSYNGNNLAVLYASSKKKLIPITILQLDNPKMNGLDGRTSRFEYNASTNEWVPVSIGKNEQPSSIEYINSMIIFQNSKVSHDAIFHELQKLCY